ncbi:hypothetical protein LTR37_001491 [Vermiconidia calcicola]|uniref:Uncharacterized protein n=1 Tax=Vermiconidia calcicola TaxID=1690605 RepID=A0ACC3NW71_9PEZI|nr:hypothetical protein LTR37_001491 [Vermiconidia calcicola]
MPTLTNLPAELRNRIYTYALAEGRTYNMKAVSPPLCRTSTSIRKDTIPIWRHHNTFVWYVKDYWFKYLLAPDSSDPDIGLRHMKHVEVILHFPDLLETDLGFLYDRFTDGLLMEIINCDYTLSHCNVEKQDSTFRLNDVRRVRDALLDDMGGLGGDDRIAPMELNEEVIVCDAI